MKKIIIGTLAMGSLLLGCQSQGPQKVELKTDNDKVFYTVGSMFGSRLKNLSLSEMEINAIAQGLRDAAQGQKPAVKLEDYQMKIQSVFRERIEKSSKKIKKDGSSYLEKFLKEDGAKKTASGLAYKVLKEGTGATPSATDIVEVHYHGTLIGGEVFDSSVDRKKKVSFPLNRVIKGWTEGLQLIKEGGKVRLVIPSELAYGDNGAPPKIPGGATLIFDVELFSIKSKPSSKKAGMKKKMKKGKK